MLEGQAECRQPGTVPQANFLTETDGQLITRDLHVLSRTGTLTVDVFGFDGSTRLTDVQVRVNDVANGYAFLGYLGAAEANGRYVFEAISHSPAGMQVLVQTPNGAASAEAVDSVQRGSRSPHVSAPVQLLLTGGDGSLLTAAYPSARYFPSLAMHGLALCAWHQKLPKAGGITQLSLA